MPVPCDVARGVEYRSCDSEAVIDNDLAFGSVGYDFYFLGIEVSQCHRGGDAGNHHVGIAVAVRFFAVCDCEVENGFAYRLGRLVEIDPGPVAGLSRVA